MAEPNAATLEAPAAESVPAASTSMTAEERMSHAFARLAKGEDAAQIRADLYRDPADSPEGDDGAAPAADASDHRQTGQPDPKSPPAPAPAGTGTDKGSAAAPDEDFLRAQAVILRDGEWTAEDLAKLPRERVMKIAEHRRGVQSQVDRFGAQKGQKPNPENQPEGTDGGATPPPADDTDPLVSEVAEFDPQLAKRVSAAIKAERAQVQTSRASAVRAEFQETMTRMQGTYPELGDQANRDKVIAKATALAETGDYGGTEGFRTLVDHSVMLVFGDRRAQKAQEDLIRKNREARMGQVDTQPDSPTEKEPMTRDQKDSYALKLLSRGYSPAETRRIVDMIPDR